MAVKLNDDEINLLINHILTKAGFDLQSNDVQYINDPEEYPTLKCESYQRDDGSYGFSVNLIDSLRYDLKQMEKGLYADYAIEKLDVLREKGFEKEELIGVMSGIAKASSEPMAAFLVDNAHKLKEKGLGGYALCAAIEEINKAKSIEVARYAVENTPAQDVFYSYIKVIPVLGTLCQADRIEDGKPVFHTSPNLDKYDPEVNKIINDILSPPPPFFTFGWHANKAA